MVLGHQHLHLTIRGYRIRRSRKDHFQSYRSRWTGPHRTVEGVDQSRECHNQERQDGREGMGCRSHRFVRRPLHHNHGSCSLASEVRTGNNSTSFWIWFNSVSSIGNVVGEVQFRKGYPKIYRIDREREQKEKESNLSKKSSFAVESSTSEIKPYSESKPDCGNKSGSENHEIVTMKRSISSCADNNRPMKKRIKTRIRSISEAERIGNESIIAICGIQNDVKIPLIEVQEETWWWTHSTIHCPT